MVYLAISPTSAKPVTTEQSVDDDVKTTTTLMMNDLQQQEDEQQPPLDDKKCANSAAERPVLGGKWDIIIPNPKSRKQPRLCFFVTALLFLMIAALVLILVIKISLSSRHQTTCCSNDTDSEQQLWKGEATSESKPAGLALDISWEMKRAFLELRQIMGDFQPLSMFPVYRKDLAHDYIAYYEVKVKHQDGFSYAVISAGERTGDYSLVETGGLPSPLEKLRDQAFINGHYCSKFFRLTTDGVTICEDYRLNRVVATTGDIDPTSPMTSWQQLDGEVRRALREVKQDWQRMASVASKIKEWKISGKTEVHDEPIAADEDDVTERGLHPGEFTEIPVDNVTEVRLKFVGLTRSNPKHRRAANLSFSLWQHRLCRALNNICNPSKPTTISHNARKFIFAGSRYLKLTVNSDEKYVKMTLKNEEVRFLVELDMADGGRIVMHYGIALGGHRPGRSVERLDYKIPDEHLFPSIHYDTGSCASATTMLSGWAMIFGYYDNLARTKPQLGYRKLGFTKTKSNKHASTTRQRHDTIANTLESKLDMKCSGRVAKYWDKSRLEHWFQGRNGPRSKIFYISGHHKRPKATRKAINLLRKGVPVLISIEHEFKARPLYGVVTRMRQQRWSYRRCDYVGCSSWQDTALTEFYVRDGRPGGRWQTACTYYAAAAII